MFFEFLTKRNEKVYMNINHIVFITPTKNGALIVDVTSNDYETLESYDELISRLSQLENQNYDKMTKMTKNGWQILNHYTLRYSAFCSGACPERFDKMTKND